MQDRIGVICGWLSLLGHFVTRESGKWKLNIKGDPGVNIEKENNPIKLGLRNTLRRLANVGTNLLRFYWADVWNPASRRDVFSPFWYDENAKLWDLAIDEPQFAETIDQIVFECNQAGIDPILEPFDNCSQYFAPAMPNKGRTISPYCQNKQSITSIYDPLLWPHMERAIRNTLGQLNKNGRSYWMSGGNELEAPGAILWADKIYPLFLELGVPRTQMFYPCCIAKGNWNQEKGRFDPPPISWPPNATMRQRLEAIAWCDPAAAAKMGVELYEAMALYGSDGSDFTPNDKRWDEPVFRACQVVRIGHGALGRDGPTAAHPHGWVIHQLASYFGGAPVRWAPSDDGAKNGLSTNDITRISDTDITIRPSADQWYQGVYWTMLNTQWYKDWWGRGIEGKALIFFEHLPENHSLDIQCETMGAIGRAVGDGSKHVGHEIKLINTGKHPPVKIEPDVPHPPSPPPEPPSPPKKMNLWQRFVAWLKKIFRRK